MMRPWSSTAIWSALRTVDRRCSMVMVVRPRARVSNACWTARSVSVSRALVASSSTSTRGSRSSVRTIERVAQQRAGDRDALLFSAGEPVAAGSHHGVVTVGQAGDQVVDLRRAGGVLDLGVAGAGLGVA